MSTSLEQHTERLNRSSCWEESVGCDVWRYDDDVAGL